MAGFNLGLEPTPQDADKRAKKFRSAAEFSLEDWGRRAGQLIAAKTAEKKRKYLSKMLKHVCSVTRRAIENLGDESTELLSSMVIASLKRIGKIPTGSPEEFLAWTVQLRDDADNGDVN